MWIDGDGFDHPFTPPATTSLHENTPTRAIKTQGTNCAFRRDALLAIGGFDPGFAFYLDEADVNLRLAQNGGLTAIVPDAVVHHGFAASTRRRADRVPTDLTQIGHSLGRFTARHGQNQTALPQHIAQQRARLIRHMVSGALEPRAVGHLMAGLLAGIDAGLATAQVPHNGPLAPTQQPFTPLPNTAPRPGRLLFGTKAQRQKLEAEAQIARANGEIVTIILLSRGIRPHTQHFTDNGWWEQSGGRFGQSFRSGPRIVFHPAPQRHTNEAARLAKFRPIGPVLRQKIE